MKVRELIGRLREFEPEAEVRLQLGSRDFAPSAWVGIMDTAGLFDEEKNRQLVIAAWAPEEYLKPGSDLAAKERKELRAREAARRLADLGGTMPDPPAIPRRRRMRKSNE